MQHALLVLVALTAIQRIFELRISAKNLRTLRKETKACGGVIWPGDSPFWFHALVLVQLGLLSMPILEAHLLPRHTPLLQTVAAVSLWTCGQSLRLWSQKTLGTSWNARGIVSSTQSLVIKGPYRYLRHPNYFGVMLEMIAIPLAGSAWFSLIGLNLAVLPLLQHRIQGEERLLSRLHHYSDLPGTPLSK